MEGNGDDVASIGSADEISRPEVGDAERVGSWPRRLVTLGGALVVFWLLYVTWQLTAGVLALRAGAEDLRAVRRQATIEGLLLPETADQLEQAEAHFAEAQRHVSGPLLAPLRIVPVVGRHIEAVDDLSAAGDQGTALASDALTDLQGLADRPTASGPERVTTLRSLAEVADDAATSLHAIDPGGSKALFGPLGTAVREVDEQREDATRGATRLAATARGLATVLEGPTPYLLLGANNAEMRNGSGMFLSAAELGFDDGRLELGDVRPTAELVLPEGSAPVDGDLEANWGWLEPGRDLRQLGLSADFPQSAEAALHTWAEVPGTSKVGGVIAVDVDGLRSLLRVVGPVQVDGVTYSADTVRGELLRQQYARFADDRDARRDQLGVVAKAVFQRLEVGQFELPALATQLADAVAGRHLMIWSSDPRLQQTWKQVGADGHLSDNSLAVGLVNRGANKLDSWLETGVDVETTRSAGGDRHLTLEVTVRNTSDGIGPGYIVGPNMDGVVAGEHRGFVVANLPAGTTDVVVEGGRPFLEGGDGPTVVVGAEVAVLPGKSTVVTVTATLPDDLEAVVLEPSARIPRATWTIDGREIKRDRRQTVDLGPS